MSVNAGMVPTPNGTLGQEWRLLVLIEGKIQKSPPIYLHFNFSIYIYIYIFFFYK